MPKQRQKLKDWFVLEIKCDKRTNLLMQSSTQPGLFVTGIIQNERKLSYSGSFSFSSWHMNTAIRPIRTQHIVLICTKKCNLIQNY